MEEGGEKEGGGKGDRGDVRGKERGERGEEGHRRTGCWNHKATPIICGESMPYSSDMISISILSEEDA